MRPRQADDTAADSAEVYIVPACEKTASDPPLCLGASAGLLTPGDWGPDPANRDEGTKIQYEFETIREPGHATQGWGNVYVFKIEQGVDQFWRPFITWRTDNTDTNEWKVAPGVYDYAHWAFTEPGTYVFHVHAKGHPNKGRTGGPIVDADTVTSLVRTYTFHVGDLTLVEPPQFQVERSVQENVAAGTNVGDPIAVTVADDGDTLDYWLTGEGSLPFDVTSVTDGAQITVATGASLDYETTPTYDLTLNVSDGLGRTNYIDLATDHTLAVHITLTDDPSDNPPSVALGASTTTPTVGNKVVFTATVSNSPVSLEHLHYTWNEYDVATDQYRVTANRSHTWEATHTSAGARRYSVRVWYRTTDGTVVRWNSNELEVTWSNS